MATKKKRATQKIKQGILDPKSANSVTLLIVASVIAGFGFGLGYMMAEHLLKTTKNETRNLAFRVQQRARRAYYQPRYY